MLEAVPPFERTWPATGENVRAARLAITAYVLEASATTPPVEDIALAVSEAATTIVDNARETDGSFTVTATVREDAIVVTVDDGADGVVSRHRELRDQLSTPLISGVSDGFIERTTPEGATQLWMLFPLAAP